MEGLSILNGMKDRQPSWPAVPTDFNPTEVGPALSDFQRPVRIEGEIYNLEVEGEIPEEIAGTFYRIMPDPAFPPFIKDDIVRSYDLEST
jgi:carotenoid cleavage dioxygenase-like enzyme